MPKRQRPTITKRSRLTPDPVPPIGERVGVRLFKGESYEVVEEGIVTDRYGWVKASPVWVRFRTGYGAWFEIDRIVRYR